MLNLIEGQYAPGDPILADLITDDMAAARDFYGPLFEWEFEETSGHTRAIKGRRWAAGLGMMAGLDLAGPRWWLCLAAPNLNELQERAQGALAGTMDLKDLGTAAVLTDPAGATAILWEADNLEPGALGRAHGGMVWTELVTDDPETVGSFYESLFDVKAVPVEAPSAGGALNLERKELEVPRRFAGIVPADRAADGGSLGARWRPFFQVDDLDAFLRQAEDAGAKVGDERMSASRRRIAVLTDPQGAEFGVVEGTASTQVEPEET